MFLSKIDIENYRHLSNINLSLTYKTGSLKGEPLKKVCFIGQSATGKTSLLDFIKEQLNTNKNKEDYIFYFSADSFTDHFFKWLSKKPEHEFNVREKVSKSEKKRMMTFLEKEVLVFDKKTMIMHFEQWIDDITIYRHKLTQIGSDLINKGFGKNLESMYQDLEKWKSQNPNPLEDLALNCFNPILKKLNLEVDLENTSCFIPLKSLNGKHQIIPDFFSTGTKQIINYALPIYKNAKKLSHILIDEPERSLYPDIQIEIMDYLINLSPNSQYIIATHSPFIAASFEPEERFYLYFTDSGEVEIIQGNNSNAPIGDDPNDVLIKDFRLETLNGKKGNEAYHKYIELKQELFSMNGKNSDKKEKLILEMTKLGDTYNF